MAQVRRSKEAEEDLVNIWLHIAEDDPVAANGVIDFLDEQFHHLLRTPTIGRVRKDLWPSALCFVAFKPSWRSRFLFFYHRVEQDIEIARVLEGHQDIDEDFFG